MNDKSKEAFIDEIMSNSSPVLNMIFVKMYMELLYEPLFRQSLNCNNNYQTDFRIQDFINKCYRIYGEKISCMKSREKKTSRGVKLKMYDR